MGFFQKPLPFTLEWILLFSLHIYRSMGKFLWFDFLYCFRVLLSGNLFRSLQMEMFANVQPKLTTLRIDRNQLNSLKINVFKKLPGLKRIYLYGNPWVCACLENLLSFFRQKNITYEMKVFSDGKLPTCVIHKISEWVFFCLYFFINSFISIFLKFPETKPTIPVRQFHTKSLLNFITHT